MHKKESQKEKRKELEPVKLMWFFLFPDLKTLKCVEQINFFRS